MLALKGSTSAGYRGAGGSDKHNDYLTDWLEMCSQSADAGKCSNGNDLSRVACLIVAGLVFLYLELD